MRRSIAVVAALSPILVLGAFLDAPRPGAPDAVALQGQAGIPGTYELATVDGHALPYVVNEPGRPADAPPPPTVVGGTFTVNPDSTFQHVMRFRITRNGTERLIENPGHGTYAREGEGYRFTWAGAGQTPLTLRGDTLIMDNEGTLFRYIRQPRH